MSQKTVTAVVVYVNILFLNLPGLGRIAVIFIVVPEIQKITKLLFPIATIHRQRTAARICYGLASL